MFQVNSEIMRYYWQEFSLQRTIAMPAVLFAIVYLMFLSDASSIKILEVSTWTFYIIIFLWGGA